MFEVKQCPVCQSKEWKTLYEEVIDHSISKEKFRLIKCTSCNLIVTSPRPYDEKLSEYYQSDEYISHSGKSNNFLNTIYLQARKFSLRWKLDLIKSFNTQKSLLDIGCGTGEFLNICQENRWTVSGIEPSSAARKKTEQLINKTVENSIETIDGTFNIITMWHVLEHMPKLNETLDKINKLLSHDGKLLIAVPNNNSRDSNSYKEYWAGFDVPRHLWHFTKKPMVLLLQNHGLTLENIIPMKLDAFYVSMLSEKYKRNKSGITTNIIGFLNGLKSNRQASKSGEYSSLIYVAKK